MSKPQKRGGKWRIRFVNADGERESRTFATQKLALSELRRLEVGVDETKIRRERFGLDEELTVAEAYTRFTARRKPDPSNTARRHQERVDAHERAFEHHIKPHIGDRKLSDLTPAVLRRWLDTLAEKQTARPGEVNEDKRTLSASTIRGVVTTLRQICKANDVPLVVHMPDSLRQKRRRSRPRALQCLEDVRALLRACEREPWFRVAVALSCFCGLRLGEVASLRWRHVHGTTITVALSWEGPLKARFEDDEDAARTVPLSPELAAILTQWRAVTQGRDDDRVVLKHGRLPLVEKDEDMAAKTRSACKRAELAPLTFHSLRATYATIAADQGLPIGKLSALLGHADASTTAIYIRPESESAALDPRAVLGAPADVN